MITRIAPTPSGYLHQGNAFNFLLNWLMARAQGGKVLLRVDDLDAPRAKPEYVADVFETLEWLSLEWDLGPTNPVDLAETWSQNHRLPLYHVLLERLRTEGHLFACECSRKTLAELGGVYSGTCRHKNIPFDQPDVAWRVTVDANETIHFMDGWQGEITMALGQEVGSFVVRRRDGIPAYQIASLVDDVQFGITHIARGIDLLSSTASQLYLARLLGLDAFTQSQFYHHPLLLDAEGQKLSKSAGSMSLRHLRENDEAAVVLLHNFVEWAGIEMYSSELSPLGLLASWKESKPFKKRS